MRDRTHKYESPEIEIRYSLGRCIHAAECVRGLPEVFDPDRKPWIDPNAADAGSIASTVERCPTGALHYDRKDGGAAEVPDETNTITAERRGPLYVRGDIIVQTSSGDTIVEDTRVALCRCGQSSNKPFCDNAHLDTGFSHDGRLGEGGVKSASAKFGDRLEVTASENGPFVVRGRFRLEGSDGEMREGEVASFCRCGQSSNKPFCDGTHRKVGFRS